ncbi:penicillin-binding protein [Candidatus Gottesmanbacteria bacterium]|nr:penicillin-binding protein [Candidatus Gottesmanbacteria bacterium]
MLDVFLERQRRRRFGRRESRLKLWTTVAVVSFLGLFAITLFVGILFAWYARDLPRPDKVQRSDGLSTLILDRNGENLYDIYQNVNRIPAKFSDIPKDLRNATVAVEDKDFYKHQGLSAAGFVRAVINIFVFHNFQGGSTLTQQLVKNVLLTNEQSLPRKIKEAILAIQIERKYTKDEILQMYLNEVPYGGTAVGVESASEYYFSKPVQELTLLESAVLAGLPQSPSRYSPYTGDGKAYIWRTEQVIRRMREDGYITIAQEIDLKSKLPKVVFAKGDSGLRAPHFVAYVKDKLIEMFGEKRVEGGGLRVTTTLDWKLQEQAQKIVLDEVSKAKTLKVSNGAAVAIDPKTGEILAMVGSKDYSATDSGGFKFNVATQGLRQPGSTMKPITYASAFLKGYTGSTLLMDVDTKYPSGEAAKPEYNPKNYDGKFHGPTQLRFALGNSINTIAVKVSALAGIRDILRVAYDMGLSTLEPTDANLKRFGLSLTLGGGEVTLLDMTSAFGVFATEGLRQIPVAIKKVVDAKGAVLFELKTVSPKRVLPDDISYIVSHILSDNNARKDAFGERSMLATVGKTVAVKTGTTDDKRDNWTIGYTPSMVVGTWVGNNDNSPMNQALASGVTGAAPIWNRIMKEALKNRPDEQFARPSTIIEMDIDAHAGGLPKDGYPTRKEVFIKGTEPTSQSLVYQTKKVSKKDGNKLANVVELAKGEYDTRSFVNFTESDPVSGDGKNRWQEGIDIWVSAQSDPKFHVPKETYQGSDQIIVILKEPSDFATINSNSIQVSADVSSTNDVSKIEIFVDDSKVKEVNGSSINESISIANGSHILKVKGTDSKGNTADRQVHLGINQSYVTPSPTPTPTP